MFIDHPTDNGYIFRHVITIPHPLSNIKTRIWYTSDQVNDTNSSFDNFTGIRRRVHFSYVFQRGFCFFHFNIVNMYIRRVFWTKIFFQVKFLPAHNTLTAELTGYIVSARVLARVRRRRAMVAGTVVVGGRRTTAAGTDNRTTADSTCAATAGSETGFQFVDALCNAYRVYPIRFVLRRHRGLFL